MDVVARAEAAAALRAGVGIEARISDCACPFRFRMRAPGLRCRVRHALLATVQAKQA